MKLFFKIFILLSLSFPFSSFGQTILHATEFPGKLIKDTKVSSFILNSKAMQPSKLNSYAKTVNAVFNEMYSSKELNPPKGFDARIAYFGTINLLKEKIPYGTIRSYFRYLVKSAGTVKTSQDGADLNFELNDQDGFFDKIGNFWEECYKLKFPLFFEQLPLTDSTPDYLEINFKYYGFPFISNNVTGSPIRIITANNKPLLVPLTRKEFVQFLIAREKRRIKENEELIADEKKQINETKKEIEDPLFKSAKETLEKSIPGMQQQIETLGNRNQTIQLKIGDLNSMIKNMSPTEASSAARLNENTPSEEIFGLEQLVPAGRKEGVMLTKVNPDYYNFSANAPAVQLITVYYSWPTGPLSSDPDYLQKTTMEIFQHLDYHQLKESMK
jgi:hypothetical protein